MCTIHLKAVTRSFTLALLIKKLNGVEVYLILTAQKDKLIRFRESFKNRNNILMISLRMFTFKHKRNIDPLPL